MIRGHILLDDREISLDGVSADLVETAPGVYSVLIGRNSYLVRVSRVADGYELLAGGYRFQAQVRDPRGGVRTSRSVASGGNRQIKAQMPGKVVRLLVVEGQVVDKGQGLLVVEAMKMQNEMKAPQAGTVLKIGVTEGATVGAGAILVELG